MSESHELSLEQVLDQIGLTGWLALSYRCAWDRWPPSMSKDVYQVLLDQKLVDPTPAPNAYGAPNADGRTVANRFHAVRPQLCALLEASDDRRAEKLLRDSMFLPHPADPETENPFETFAEDSGFDTENVDDPGQWTKSLLEIAKDPAALRAVSAEMATMMSFLKKVVESLEKLPAHLKRHYRGELMAIGKDLVRDLNLGKVTEEQVHQTLLVFLQSDDDDDDDPDPAPAPLPEDGETVLA